MSAPRSMSSTAPEQAASGFTSSPTRASARDDAKHQHHDDVGHDERGTAHQSAVEPAIVSTSASNYPQPPLNKSSAAPNEELDEQSSVEASPQLYRDQDDGLRLPGRFKFQWPHASSQLQHVLHHLVDEQSTSSAHDADHLYRIPEDAKPNETTPPVFNHHDGRIMLHLNPQSTPSSWQSHQDNLAALMRNLSLLNSSTTRNAAADGLTSSDQPVNNLLRQLRSLLDPHALNATNVDSQQPTLHHAHQQQHQSHLHLHQQVTFPSQQQHQHFAPYQHDEYHASSVSTRSSTVPRSHSMPSFNSLAAASCHNHGCTWSGPVDHLGMHQHECSLQQAVCRFHKIGCNFRGTRQQISDHLTQAMALHLELSEQKIDELQNQVDSRRQQQHHIPASRSFPSSLHLLATDPNLQLSHQSLGAFAQSTFQAAPSALNQSAANAGHSSLTSDNAFDLDEHELCQLISRVLCEHGKCSVGKLGSLLHAYTNNHRLATMCKERFGGLKKFLERHRALFAFANDHPFNPSIWLRSSFLAANAISTQSNASTGAHLQHTTISMHHQNSLNY